MRTTAGVSFLAGDPHGTSTQTVSAANAAVTTRRLDPFGNPRGAQPTWPGNHGFVNGPTEPTGLTHLGAREYDPTIGRFTSVDPILDAADIQSLNGFAYANNSPVTGFDPTGLANCGPDAYRCGGAPGYDSNGHYVGTIAAPELTPPPPPPPAHRCGVGCFFGKVGHGTVNVVNGAVDTVTNDFVQPVQHYVSTYVAAAVVAVCPAQLMQACISGAPDVSAGLDQPVHIPLGGDQSSPGYHAGGVAGRVAEVAIPSARVARAVAVARAGARMAGVQAAGRAGERAAGIVKNTDHIPSLSGTVPYRVPDELNSSVLGEVKNVSRLSYTKQLRDFSAYAIQQGLTFNLYVRGSTTLSGPLQDAVDGGEINLVRSLPG
jgi:RHS repeat-associated protein